MTSPIQQDASVLDRVFALLDAFSSEHPEMTVRQLSARSGVSRSSTHRLTQELLAWGALERTDRGLGLGAKLFELGTLVPLHTTLRSAATPFLHTLHDVTKLTANLAVRDASGIVYLEKMGTPTLDVPHTRLGGRGTLHATALGKALLAFGEIDTAVLKSTLRPVTPHSLTSMEALRAELVLVRQEKVAYDVEESQLGLFCVASPILDARGQAIAAISVTGATALSQAQKFAPTVIATAAAISRRLRSPRAYQNPIERLSRSNYLNG